MSRFQVQAKATTLYGSGTGIGDSSVRLTAFTDIYGNVLTMADFGTLGHGTIEPGTSAEEAITWSGVTNNGDGSLTLTGVKHVLAKSPYTQTSGLNLGHSGGTRFVVSNTAAFYAEFLNENEDAALTGVITAPVPTVSGQLATKGYVDGVAVAGAPNASTTVKGIVEEATDAELQVGTAAGATGAELFAGGASHTQTPTANKVPVAKANAKIDDGWLGLTTAGDLPYSDGTDVQRLAVGTSGQFLSSTGSAPSWVNPTSTLAAPSDIQVFSTSGTWTKPANAKFVQVVCVGAGGGGSGGARGVSGAIFGGSGGGGGAARVVFFRASDLGATETITIGVGGTSGAGATATGNGSNGGNGSSSSFGAWLVTFGGGGGTGSSGGGGGSQVSSGVLSVGGSPAVSANAIDIQGPTFGSNDGFNAVWSGGTGGGGQSSSNPGSLGGSSLYGGGGGGGGAGSISTGGTGAGGAGGKSNSYSAGGGGTSIGLSQSACNAPFAGGGGGGGNGTFNTTGGSGNAGGTPGGGGGGGGGVYNNGANPNGGAGGVGGPGFVRVTTFF